MKKWEQKYNAYREEIKKDVLSLFKNKECTYMTKIYNDAYIIKKESAA